MQSKRLLHKEIDKEDSVGTSRKVDGRKQPQFINLEDK